MELQLRQLSFSYPGRPVFSGLSLTLRSGQVLCILGPNGAGKTTLLSCIMGLLHPAGGQVLLDGADAGSLTPRQLAQCVSFVPQLIVPTFDYEVLEYVVTGCAPRLGTFQRPSREHYEQGMAALEKMGIAHLAHACYTQISGGERQQVSIARALAQRSALILMDEPTAHLDYGNQMKVLRTVCALAGEGYAVALTTHNPDHALLLDDQVAVLDRSGRFTCGPCTQIMTEPFLQALYGLPLTLCYVPQAGRPACVAPKLE